MMKYEKMKTSEPQRSSMQLGDEIYTIRHGAVLCCFQPHITSETKQRIHRKNMQFILTFMAVDQNLNNPVYIYTYVFTTLYIIYNYYKYI